MIIGLIGDLEGDRDWAVRVLRTLGERGDVEVVCQLGDLRFGMGADPEGYLAAIESVCAEFGLRLLCINGNHENWARLDELWAEPRWRDGDGSHEPIDVSDHVTLLPRGHRWDLGGRSFVGLGGAPSVNRLLLTEGVDWWPSEVIQEEHVEATISAASLLAMPRSCSPTTAPDLRTAPTLGRHSVRTTATTRTLRTGGFPFNDPWLDWRPDPPWEVPVVPADATREYEQLNA